MKSSLFILIAVLISLCCPKTNEKKNRQLEMLFVDDTYQLTGVAVSQTGRLFTNYPYWSDIYRHAVVEVFPNYQSTPYPDLSMNTWKPGDKETEKWICVQAVYTDDHNSLWVVDP